ncbi:hypothetical protein LOTGIDRAFT_160855 [Lottia gigantea]|uniref:Fucolectin tachylectin-4 pentraxin-1 domain-containing protein n=1 Tax=Lottia gigantea TaxID=225164 RepID=V4C0W3_LOTGI|nr:hypothetical protein LOTGIDRAFT_160855 [Lottia gigantea]ESO95094.1 hypothetical protein LOTGIDRAFT_160855 [Lottia gigantea]
MAPNIQHLSNLLVLLVIICKVSAKILNGTNLALGKTAIQSSNHQEYKAEKAVDGKTSGYFQENSCSHTYQYSRNVSEWWEVDLGSVYDITDIIIYNRIDCCGSHEPLGILLLQTFVMTMTYAFVADYKLLRIGFFGYHVEYLNHLGILTGTSIVFCTDIICARETDAGE